MPHPITHPTIAKFFPWLAPVSPQSPEASAPPHDSTFDAVEAIHLFYAVETFLDMAIFLLQHQTPSAERQHLLAQAGQARRAIIAGLEWQAPEDGGA